MAVNDVACESPEKVTVIEVVEPDVAEADTEVGVDKVAFATTIANKEVVEVTLSASVTVTLIPAVVPAVVGVPVIVPSDFKITPAGNAVLPVANVKTFEPAPPVDVTVKEKVEPTVAALLPDGESIRTALAIVNVKAEVVAIAPLASVTLTFIPV